MTRVLSSEYLFQIEAFNIFAKSLGIMSDSHDRIVFEYTGCFGHLLRGTIGPYCIASMKYSVSWCAGDLGLNGRCKQNEPWVVWIVMKEGEEQFEGLYEVLVYKEKQRLKNDFMTLRFSECTLFCQSFVELSDMFEVWLHRLCACIQHRSDDQLAHQRLIEIWRLCNDLQTVIQRKSGCRMICRLPTIV